MLQMGLAFVIVMPLAVWTAWPFMLDEAEVPQDPSGGNSVWFIVGALGFVALAVAMAVFILWAVRTGRHKILQGMVLTAVAVALLMVLARPILLLTPYLGPDVPWLLGMAVCGVAAWRLWKVPDRRVLNGVAIVVGAGVAGLTGALLGVTPLLFLLVAIALYDQVAVKKTKHMQKLAKATMDLRLPVALQLGGPAEPRRSKARAASAPASTPADPPPTPNPPTDTGANASLVEFQLVEPPAGPAAPAAPTPPNPAAPPAADTQPTDVADGERMRGSSSAARAAAPARVVQRRAAPFMLLGLGDLVFPSALVAAASDPRNGWGWGPAVACGIGVLVGYALLGRIAWKGAAQPGLPLLNGGAVVGFFAGLLLATGSLRFW
jgi:presenilin-like A22 family membrane protease